MPKKNLNNADSNLVCWGWRQLDSRMGRADGFLHAHCVIHAHIIFANGKQIVTTLREIKLFEPNICTTCNWHRNHIVHACLCICVSTLFACGEWCDGCLQIYYGSLSGLDGELGDSSNITQTTKPFT